MGVDPCSVCGSKDLNLIDGYYYCVECGTQDTNVRETVIEQQFFADGTFAQTTKRKILINEDKVQMTGEWYKWHTFNFILNGLADELIALGAEATFKTKLLWIWTLYVKKFQKKDKMGLSQVNENETGLLQFIEDDGKHNNDMKVDSNSFKVKKKVTNKSYSDLTTITTPLIISMLYAALNLDKSHIQISHLFRFMDEGRLIIANFSKYIPEDMNVKSIPDWTNFLKSCGPMGRIGTIRCRGITMALFKQLNLGPPVVPDIKKIIDNYVTELCLPTEFKTFVLSLMYLWPCDFLDVDSRSVKSLSKVPDYECFAMAYVVIGLKMCFGLDDDYEYRLSDVVDKINTNEKFSKCYHIGFTPEPTGRFFSFREWITFLQFRRIKLIKARMLKTNEEHYLDVDDYIYMEYLMERPQKNNISMTDQLSMDIINKLSLEEDIDIIPKVSFPTTLTPLTTYTEVLAHNCRSTQDVELLIEDFTQYSLTYACENMSLIDLQNNLNIVKGISNQGKTITNSEIMCGYLKGIKSNRQVKMVYVKNCQNKNWLTTNKPTMDHVVIESIENNCKYDDESDHGYDFNLPNTPSDTDVITQASNEVSNKVLETIPEEDEDKNVFDDTFGDDEEEKAEDIQDDCNVNNVEQNEICDDQIYQSDDEDKKSITSTESVLFNPETFNRERAIKELIIQKCKKYKIPIPEEYRTIEPRKRKREDIDDAEGTQRKHIKTRRGEVKDKIHKLLEAYYSHLEKDVMNQVSQQLNLIINNMDQTKQDDISYHEAIETTANGEPNSSVLGYTNVSEISSIAPEISQVNISKLENDEQNVDTTLFNDENVCENIEDFTVKNDPNFDETKYNVNQLYIKVNDEEPEDIYESLKDPELDEIIEKKIEECKHKKITASAEKQVNESSDSEDDIPLSVLREEKKAYFEDTGEKFESLVLNDHIPNFKYWVKRYNTAYMAREQNVGEKFDSEIAENMPKSFSFLLRECAPISGCTQFNVYKCVQHIERNLIFCSKTSVE